MELWFIFAVASFIFSGFHVFGQKLSAEYKYNSNVVNSIGAGIAGFFSLIIVFFLEGFSELSLLLVGLALLQGVVFLIGTNIRTDALRYIDTTLFFPLHKFISPIAAIIFGIVLFQETITAMEWVGLVLGVTVPLLLLNREEGTRQRNLTKGLILMAISAFIGATAAVINKYSADIFSSMMLYATASHILAAFFGLMTYKLQKNKQPETRSMNFKDRRFVGIVFLIGIMQTFGFGALLYALNLGGELAIVYTINSLYILIPIILSIIFFNEHWNMRKVFAVILSIISLAFLR